MSGLTNQSMRKLKLDDMIQIEPLTDNNPVTVQVLGI